MTMERAHTWRDLLHEVIASPAEHQRIAAVLGVNPVTLTRWVENKARPRAHNRKKLIDAMPAHLRQELASLLAQEFPEDLQPSPEGESELLREIPSAFYARIFNAYTSTPATIRTSSIFSVVLQQMLAHLDADQEGLSITAVRCTQPPPGQPVRSLQEFIGRGTAPFKPYQEAQQYFLGAESLAGSAVAHCAKRVNQNLRAATYAPALRTDFEESAMACPFTFEGRIAGCLLVSSTRLNFFTPRHQQIIQEYTNLLVLALRREDFYEQSLIELVVMPPAEQQASYFAAFRSRVVDKLRRFGPGELSEAEAELLVYQEIESEIIQPSTGTETAG